MITSSFIQRDIVSFPEFTGERAYMIPFLQKDGLPKSLGRWQKTVNQMLSDIKTDKPIYVMIDQSRVLGGKSQRRSGVHVEGNWIGDEMFHKQPTHFHGLWKGPTPGWSHSFEYDPELVLLASDVQGCAVYSGTFDDVPNEQGGCEHFDLSDSNRVLMESGRSYLCTAETLHESLPLLEDSNRTLIRLNIPGEKYSGLLQ